MALPWHSVAQAIADLNLKIVNGHLNLKIVNGHLYKRMKSCHPAKPWGSRDFFTCIGYHTHNLEGYVPSSEYGYTYTYISTSRGTTMPFCGGVKAYNEQRSLRVKYCRQRVQTLFYVCTPSAQDPLGNTSSQGFTEDSGNARANIPNA